MELPVFFDAPDKRRTCALRASIVYGCAGDVLRFTTRFLHTARSLMLLLLRGGVVLLRRPRTILFSLLLWRIPSSTVGRTLRTWHCLDAAILHLLHLLPRSAVLLLLACVCGTAFSLCFRFAGTLLCNTTALLRHTFSTTVLTTIPACHHGFCLAPLVRRSLPNITAFAEPHALRFTFSRFHLLTSMAWIISSLFLSGCGGFLLAGLSVPV